jgi:hypothetical protein
MENKNNIFIECRCGSEMLNLERIEYSDTDNDLCISFYRYGHNGWFPWKFRLQYIWWIITKGHPYSDSIILNKREQDKLIEFLQQGKNSKELHVFDEEALKRLKEMQSEWRKE